MKNRIIFKIFDIKKKNSDINNINFFSYGRTFDSNK